MVEEKKYINVASKIWNEELTLLFKENPDKEEISLLFVRGFQEGIKWTLENKSEVGLTKIKTATKFIKIAAFKGAEVIGVKEKLEVCLETLFEIKSVLIGMQPHIPQACKEGHESFIDSYVDRCLSLIDKTLEE